MKNEKARILIVEDQDEMALLIQRNLKRLGHEVSARVMTGEYAIVQVKENTPDLVLMDITLSGNMDGIEAARQIQAIKPIPIVYITGYLGIEQWEEAKITEPFGYITKPFELRELDVVIAAALYKFRKEQELLAIQNDFKEAHRQLVQLEKLALLGQLLAGVAHELNNPISFISSNFEVLEQYMDGYGEILRSVDTLKRTVQNRDMDKAVCAVDEINQVEERINLSFITGDADKLIRASKGGAERLRKIVKDLRTIARRDDEIVEMTDIEEVVDGIINIVWNEIKYKAELKKEYGKIPLVKCNAQKIGQVLINLLVNATQAIKDKGEIRIKTYTMNDHVCIAIGDTGCGIPLENISKVFTPFFTTKEAGKGTGLGLSVSYDIIKQHNGDILVESQLNQGTTFTVSLPCNLH